MPHEYFDQVFQMASSDDADALRGALDAVHVLSRVRDKDGTSLVLFCVYRGRSKCLEALTTRANEFTLHEAAATGRVDRCTALLDGALWAIDVLSPDGWTALHLAGFFGHSDVVRTLLAAGADPNVWARAFERNLPLHAACAGGPKAAEAISLLARATGDVNVRQGGGYTPLMECAGNGNLQSIEELLALGADLSLTTDKGETARDLASARGHAECAARLERALV